MTDSSQKFIARNRAPRVQIEYDVELYGSEKKVQLPFVMGVMSDLAGKSKVEQPSVADRSFLEIDVDNFDDRMRAMAPRAAFSVPNTLTGEGNIAIDLTFEKMDDFSPAAIAAKVDPLRPLLEARTQLSDLMAYMDGKSGAEALIEKILADPALLSAVSSAASAEGDQTAALDSLRALTPEEPQDTDSAGGILDALKANAPEDTPNQDRTADVLSDLAAQPGAQDPEPDRSDAVFDGLRQATPEDTPQDNSRNDALAGLRAQTPLDQPAPDTATKDALAALSAQTPRSVEEVDTTSAALTSLAASTPEAAPEPDTTTAALDSLADVDVPDAVEDTTDDLLAELAESASEIAPESDNAFSALDSLAELETPGTVEDTTDDLLAELAEITSEDLPEPDNTATVLDSLAGLEVPEVVKDTTDDLLAELAESAPEIALEPDAATTAPDSLADLDVPDIVPNTTDDLLAELADSAPTDATKADDSAAVLDSLVDIGLPDVVEDSTDDLLADLAGFTSEIAPEPDEALSALDSLAELDVPDAAEDTTDALLADLADTAPVTSPEPEGSASEALDSLANLETPETGGSDDLDDLLGDLGSDDTAIDPDAGELDALLADSGSDDTEISDATEAEPDSDDLDNLLADDSPSDDFDDLLGDLGLEDAESPQAVEAAPEPDDLLADDTATDDLDDLLGDLELEAEDPEPVVDVAAVDDLDDLLGDLGDIEPQQAGDAPNEATVSLSDEPEFAYGQLSAERPSAERLNRKRFRLAILGDFSGRAARGQLETGDALAARKPILLDPDTVEEVIEGFATDLVLPIGKDGAGVAVKLGGLDDLHPDELYENIEIFAELVGLRGQLNSGATAENAARQLREWGEKYATPVAPTRSRSSGNSVPADLKLSDFQKLIGDTAATLTQVSPLDELMAQIVGPHIRAIPDADTVAMQGAVDQALSAAMRLVLHHPEFQSVEAQWRSLDLIARSIEDDDTLDVMLYDVSAEEIGADLATADDLSQSGFVRLLTDDPLDEENGRGGYSALIGLYTFEETPPHAELLGRIARVAAHVDAPFIAAITPTFLDTDKKDRHPLVVNAWDTLRGMSEAGHLALASPRFLLRQPYGAKSEPIYEFEFEEFTMSAGLRGMLWANPAVLVAILLAKSFRQNGASMNLGSIMSLGGMPFYFVNDRYGDQVALPCTERNLTLDKVEQANARGIMSVVSIKGRDEIRLASFNSLAGAEILGPWSGVKPPPPSPPKPEPAAVAAETVDSDAGSGDDSDLDDLLADFGDDLDLGGDGDDTDADLAALLADL